MSTNKQPKRDGNLMKTRHISRVACALLFGLALFLPATAFATTAHLKENASTFITKTQGAYGSMIASAALLHNYDPKLITAVIIVESEGNARVVSPRGAEGLMQLMPRTARAMGAKNSKEPLQNILAGTKYLRELEDNYGFNSPKEALVAYNMGPTRARRWLAHSAPEKYGYVADVMYVYNLLDEQEFASARLLKQMQTRQIANETASSLEHLLTRPRSLALAMIPVSVSSGRKNEVESD